MMGLTDAMFWGSWFVISLVKNLVVVTAMVLVLVYGGLWPGSSAGLVWLFFLLFELCTIAYSFAASTLFSTTRTGSTVGTLVSGVLHRHI
jgi:hypothetical protein